jgi:hypothetical protein
MRYRCAMGVVCSRRCCRTRFWRPRVWRRVQRVVREAVTESCRAARISQSVSPISQSSKFQAVLPLCECQRLETRAELATAVGVVVVSRSRRRHGRFRRDVHSISRPWRGRMCIRQMRRWRSVQARCRTVRSLGRVAVAQRLEGPSEKGLEDRPTLAAMAALEIWAAR